MTKVVAIKDVFSANLRFIRKTFNKSQAAMAEILQVSRPSYSNYEGAKQDVPLFAALRLSEITGITVEKLAKEDISSYDRVSLLQYFAEAISRA